MFIFFADLLLFQRQLCFVDWSFIPFCVFNFPEIFLSLSSIFISARYVFTFSKLQLLIECQAIWSDDG